MVMQGIRDMGAELARHPIADHVAVKHAWVMWGGGGSYSWFMWVNGHLSTIQGWVSLGITIIGAAGSVYGAIVRARMERRMLEGK